MNNLKEHLDKFAGKKVLVLGDVFIDEYVYGDCTRISPEAPVPVLLVDTKKTRYTLGGAGNTAANITAMGGEAVLIGKQGHDEAGDRIADLCRKHMVIYEAVFQVAPTTRKTRFVAQRQQLLRVDKESVEGSGKLQEEIILAIFRKVLPFADVVVLSDYAKGFFTMGLTQTIIGETHLAGKQVIVDPKPAHAGYYSGADVITPNENEAKGMLRALAQPDYLVNLAIVLDCHILLTKGAEGTYFLGMDGIGHNCPTIPREAFDVSGAGDTVVAAYALSVAAGLDNQVAMELANLAAGIAVTKFGTYAVTKEDMLNAG